MRTESIHSVYLHESNYWQFSTIWWLACENRRLSSLFATGDVSRGGTSGSQRQIFHTDVVKSLRNPVRSADWSTEYSYIVWGTVYEWQTKDKRLQRSNVNAMNLYQNNQYLGNIVSLEETFEFCPGAGVLPYMGYIGMCRSEGYGFQAVSSRIGYINQSAWV